MSRTPLYRLSGAILLISFTAILRADPPATQAAGEANRDVLVLPFETLGGADDKSAAIADLMQRSLLRDLSRSRAFHVIPGAQVAADRDAAIRAAKDAGAGFAVWGSVQFVEGRIRVSGDVLDASRGDSVGAFKLTGTLREVFELQDQLAEQVASKLARAMPAPPADARADADDAQPRRDRRERAGVEPSEPLRVRPRSLDPDWLYVPEAARGDDGYDDITWRYNYGQLPYWSIPYGYGNYAAYGCSPFGFGYGYGYGGYHYSYYRPWRPLYQYRALDYTYRGLPDRRPWYGFGPRTLRSFNGPVPLRWLNVR